MTSGLLEKLRGIPFPKNPDLTPSPKEGANEYGSGADATEANSDFEDRGV